MVFAVDWGGLGYLNRGGDLTGNADGRKGLVSGFVNFAAAATGNEFIWDSGTNRLVLLRLSTGIIRLQARNITNTVVLQLDSVSAYNTADVWNHILGAWDLDTAGAGRLYINDADDKNEVTYTTGQDIDYTRTEHNLASQGGASILDGCISEFYLNFAEYLDVATEANRRKFVTSALKAVDLGADGSNPTGNSPIVYLPGPAATVETNQGTGGNFTRNGTIAACADAPEDAAVCYFDVSGLMRNTPAAALGAVSNAAVDAQGVLCE